MGIFIRYFLYGLALILVLLIGIGFHVSKIGYLSEQARLPPFYCSDSSIHANCLFARSLCYDINTTQWKTTALLPSNWSGVSLRSRGSLFRDNSDVAVCNNPFIPQHHSFPPRKTIYWIKGTHVLSCIWVNVFGHIFLEMMLPAWMAMTNLADRLHFSDQNITYLLDNRRNSTLAPQSFSLLSHQPVLQLLDLVNKAKEHAKSYVCFERLIVGYRLQSSLEFPHNVAHLKVGDLARYRDAMKTLHGLPLQVNMSRDVCVALLIQRTRTRMIEPGTEKEIVNMLRDRTLCTVQVATFDGIPIVEQIRLVANATILIHVSGSGSHHFIWLPDGAASLTILHPLVMLNAIGNGGPGGGGLVLNDFLCWRHPTILCVTAASNLIRTDSYGAITVDMGSFSYALDMIKLWQNNRGKFDPRDPSE